MADPSTGVVDVFGSLGGYLTQFGKGALDAQAVAVDEASGDVYVAEPLEDGVFVFKPDGSGGYELLSEWFGKGVPGEEFGEVAGVAVDNSTSASDPSAGDVYVVDGESVATERGAVDLFKPAPAGAKEAQEGEFLRALGGTKLDEPNGVAVSATTGTVYVGDSVKGAVYAFSSSGAFEMKLTGSGSPQGSFRGREEEEGNVTAVAVDESTGDLLVAEAERRVVGEFSASGEWVGWLTSTPSGRFGEPRGVGVGASGDVYVADTGLHVVDVFGPGVAVPDVKSARASKIERGVAPAYTATMNGSIEPDGRPASYRFEWGESEAYGHSTAATSAGEGEGESKVETVIEGLRAETTYDYRIVGENENGANYGVNVEFGTPAAVSDVTTGAVAKLEPHNVTLSGSLDPEGLITKYYFQYGETTFYGKASPAVETSAKETVAAEADLSALKPNTGYHYRLVAVNGFGTTFGRDAQFTTPGPPLIRSEPTTNITHEEATVHAAIDPDSLETTYHVEYGETSAYGQEAPVGGESIGAGAASINVSTVLKGLNLRPGVAYHFRVVASNSAGLAETPDQVIPSVLIESESAARVSDSAARLQAQINPLGHDSTYYFQYGTASCEADPSECTSAPAPPGSDIGSGESGVPVSVELQGLKPDTTYHYRALATNSLGTAEGADRTFTTEPVALPDGRAWEMVSPVDKHGAPIEALTSEGGWIAAAESGNAITYVADGAITEEAQGNRSPEMQQVLATRGPEGWTSQDIATPNSNAEGVSVGAAPEYQFFSRDLSLALVEPWGNPTEPPLAPEATQKTMYLRDNATGTYLPLVTEANVAPGTQFGHRISFAGATQDLSHVVLRSKIALSGSSSGPGLYEWVAGELKFVSVLPSGTPAPASHEAELGFYHDAANAISSDGTRIIWTASEGSSHRGHLYMRDTATGETIQLDAAQGAAEPAGEGFAQFQTAGSDGSRVFFTDKQRLTADSTAEPTFGQADLYECEVGEEGGKLACRLRDLSVDHNLGEHAAVQGFLFGASEDGETVALVAQGVLAVNESGDGEEAEAGKDNLYELRYDGAKSEWDTTFIAVLSSEDSPEWEGNKEADTAFLTARLSPSGEYLAFMSAASPTGYDNIDQSSGKRDEEVYLYDSSAAGLTCVSCDPTGAPPLGVHDVQDSGEGLGLLVDRREIWRGRWLAANVPGWTAQSLGSALYQSRYLLNDGRLFFNSPDDLVPQASNGKEDVYEYEPTGVGGCSSSPGGCVALLSSGSADKEAAFLEATPSGNNVFFLTAAQLVQQDTDTAFDIYDARECTQASPCLTPPAASPSPCEAASECRPGSVTTLPPIGPSGTATFSGADSVVQAPAAKQEVKGIKSSSTPLSRAQKLANAVKACRKQHPHSKKKRAACEARARTPYGPKTKAKKKTKAKGAAGKLSVARGGRWGMR